MANVILSVENVTKNFGDRIAVNNVSFKICEGEIFGFLGPNGAGKTTTMRMICGLCKITYGDIKICGYSVKNDFEKAMKNVGGLIENPLMYGYLSGYDNLRYYATLHKGIRKENILNYAKVVGLEHRLKDRVKNYSLGMRQRLGIAQALLHNPKLLILDEPLSGLDPNGVKEIRDFLKYLASKYKIAILISSHMLAEMENLCDTIGVINNGEILEVKTINQLREGVKGTRRIKYTVDYPNFAGKVITSELKFKCDIAGNSVIIHADDDKISSVAKVLVKYNISIFGVEMISKSLEEVFMQIIEKKTKGRTSIL